MRQKSPFEQTPYGFRWGGLEVRRCTDDDEGRVILEVRATGSPAKVFLAASPQGRKLYVQPACGATQRRIVMLTEEQGNADGAD